MTLHDREIGDVTIIDINGRITVEDGADIFRETSATRKVGTLKLLNVPSRIHAQLRTTRLLSVFDVFEAEAEALQSFGNDA